MEDQERLALEKREKAEAERRQREDSLRVEAERRRSENERINRERRERIEAAERERRESLDAARRDREATLARARAQRDTAAPSSATPAIEPAPTAQVPKPAAPEKTVQPVAIAPAVVASSTAPTAPTPSPAFKDLLSSAQIRAIFRRAVRAAILDRKLYEEVEADRTATPQAAIVVAAGAIASAIGVLPLLAARGPLAIPGEVAAVLLSWAAYAYAAYVLGTTAFRGRETKADWGELARTLGFASAPRVLLALGPGFAGFVWLWMLATTVVAIRAALDVTTWRAVVVALAAWLALGFVQAIATGVTRGLSPV